MASTWTEHLCMEEVAPGRFILATCKPEWLGSIYELVPEDDLYDDGGELRVPEYWEGKKIVGLGDGEYLETDELWPEQGSDPFDHGTIHVAQDFCQEHSWTDAHGFDVAWQQVLALTAASASPADAMQSFVESNLRLFSKGDET